MDSDPGAFKLDYMQPVELILSNKISILFYFHSGESNYLLPKREGLEMEKRIPPTVSETQGFQYLGH